MKRVEKLIQDLSWHNSDEQIKVAQNQLVNILTEDTLHLMIPFLIYDKCYWDNMAEVILKCSDQMDVTKNEKLMKDMFEWIQDMNWPGAMTIVEVLVKLDRRIVIERIERIACVENQDPEWLYFLTQYLVTRLKFKEEEFKDKKIYRKLMDTLD